MMKKYHPWNIWNISSILSESHNSKLCLALWFRTAVRSLQQLSGSHNRVRDIHQVVAARYFLFDLFASSWFHQSDYTKSHKMMIISRMMITVIIMCSWSSFSTSHAEHPLSKFYPVTSLSTAKAKGVRNSLNCTEIRTDFLTVQSARRMDIKIVFHAVFFFLRRVSGRTKWDATPIFWSFSRFSALTYGPTKTGTTSSKLVIQYLHTSCMSSSCKIYFGLSSTPHHPHHPIFRIHINTLHFFLSCYTSQVLGSCQKLRFRFAVTTLLFFVFSSHGCWLHCSVLSIHNWGRGRWTLDSNFWGRGNMLTLDP